MGFDLKSGSDLLTYSYFLWQTASSKEIKPLFRKNHSSKSPKFTFCLQFHKDFWKYKPKYLFSNDTFKYEQHETFCIVRKDFFGLFFQKSQHECYLSKSDKLDHPKPKPSTIPFIFQQYLWEEIICDKVQV